MGQTQPKSVIAIDFQTFKTVFPQNDCCFSAIKLFINSISFVEGHLYLSEVPCLFHWYPDGPKLPKLAISNVFLRYSFFPKKYRRDLHQGFRRYASVTEGLSTRISVGQAQNLES